MALTCAANPLMVQTGLSFVDVSEVAGHVVNLLKTQGDTALDLVNNLLKMVRAVTGRDMLQVFAALNAASLDVQTLIDAVKAEFQLG